MATRVYRGQLSPIWAVYTDDDGDWEVWGWFPQSGAATIEVRWASGFEFVANRSIADAKRTGGQWPDTMAVEIAVTLNAYMYPAKTVAAVAEATRAVCDLPCGGLGAYTRIDVEHGPCIR